MQPFILSECVTVRSIWSTCTINT